MKEKIHFIAIGGSAMHSLALALHQDGYRISGSDDEIFDPAKSRLSEAGILPPETGWFPEKLDAKPDLVILGMHAKKDNPELLRAQELHIPIYSYPEFLHRAFSEKNRIVIGGSHGKTTITSMIMHIMHFFGKEMDFIVGAQLKGIENPVKISSAPIAIIEGDEYLTSPIDPRPKFHLYKPHIALISGIAWDHINVFPSFENYVEQFAIFIQSIEKDGVLFYNAEDPHVLDLISKNSRTDISCIPYSTPSYIQKEKGAELQLGDKSIRMHIFGRHNFLNAAGAVAICSLLGIPEADCWEALSSFEGAAKRLELLYEKNGRSVYKDFAHAPSKLQSTLKAFLEKTGKALPCFELHTYSSLNKDFLPQYKHSMNDAEEAVVFFSPHALSLKRLDSLSPTEVAQAFAHPRLHIFTQAEDLKNFILSRRSDYAHVLMMSSGNWDGLNLEELAQDFVEMT